MQAAQRAARSEKRVIGPWCLLRLLIWSPFDFSFIFTPLQAKITGPGFNRRSGGDPGAAPRGYNFEER